MDRDRGLYRLGLILMSFVWTGGVFSYDVFAR